MSSSAKRTMSALARMRALFLLNPTPFSFIPEKALRKFIILILIAATFHYSALSMFFLYPIYQFVVAKSTNDAIYIKRLIITSLMVAIAFSIGFIFIKFIPILAKYALYQDASFTSNFDGLGSQNIAPQLILILVMVLFYKYIISMSTIGKFGLLASALMLIFTSVGFLFPLGGRIGDYFMPVALITLTLLIDTSPNKHHKRIARTLIIAYGLTFFIGAFYINGSGSIFPYTFIN